MSTSSSDLLIAEIAEELHLKGRLYCESVPVDTWLRPGMKPSMPLFRVIDVHMKMLRLQEEYQQLKEMYRNHSM